MGLFATRSINNIQHNSTLHYAECCYAERRKYLIVMLGVVMLSVIILSVVTPFSPWAKASNV